MQIKDSTFLYVYMQGFEDELSGESNLDELFYLLLRSYRLGKQDAIIGDDDKSVDSQTNEQILARIRNYEK